MLHVYALLLEQQNDFISPILWQKWHRGCFILMRARVNIYFPQRQRIWKHYIMKTLHFCVWSRAVQWAETSSKAEAVSLHYCSLNSASPPSNKPALTMCYVPWAVPNMWVNPAVCRACVFVCASWQLKDEGTDNRMLEPTDPLVCSVHSQFKHGETNKWWRLTFRIFFVLCMQSLCFIWPAILPQLWFLSLGFHSVIIKISWL